METSDEIPLEDHRYFRARLNHLETRHPAVLLILLENGTVTEHLRVVAKYGMRAKARLVFYKRIPEDQADELVLNQVVADPQEQSRLDDSASQRKLHMLLDQYKAVIPNLPRTYQSQSETTE